MKTNKKRMSKHPDWNLVCDITERLHKDAIVGHSDKIVTKADIDLWIGDFLEDHRWSWIITTEQKIEAMQKCLRARKLKLLGTEKRRTT
jgi:hypothetical protein